MLLYDNEGIPQLEMKNKRKAHNRVAEYLEGNTPELKV